MHVQQIMWIILSNLIQWNPSLRTTLKSDHLRYCRHFVWSWMQLHKPTYNQNPWNAETSLFRKADTMWCPNGIASVQNLLIKWTLWWQNWRFTTKSITKWSQEASYSEFQSPECLWWLSVCFAEVAGQVTSYWACVMDLRPHLAWSTPLKTGHLDNPATLTGSQWCPD